MFMYINIGCSNTGARNAWPLLVGMGNTRTISHAKPVNKYSYCEENFGLDSEYRQFRYI